jgi:hypothetical protein
MTLPQLQRRRDQILAAISSIDHLRRGSLSQQFFKPGGPHSKPQGPYYVLQGYLLGQKFSERIPAEQAPRVEEDIANYKRFQSLAEEFVTVTDLITRQTEQVSEPKKNS